MHLATLKRFEFSAARRLHGPGPESRLHGQNFVLWAGVSGPLQPTTGMIVNVVELKAVVNGVLDRYDHRNLDRALDGVEPTTVNVACAIWDDVRAALPPPIRLASIDLQEQGGAAARVTHAGASRIIQGEFAAAHRTHAPRLSEAENLARYGICNNPAGHGHNYRAEIHLPPGATVDAAVWAEFDHKNLSADIPDLRGRNVVTETIAELLARRAPRAQRVRLWETSSFFAEYTRTAPPYHLGRRYRFNAAHRLHSPALAPDENRRVYGKCNRPEPHGHTYFVEVIVAGEWDPHTDTAYDLNHLDAVAGEILQPLDYAYLDADVAAFRGRPSTGENIAAYLWAGFEARLGQALESVRLWETPNNQFAVMHRR